MKSVVLKGSKGQMSHNPGENGNWEEDAALTDQDSPEKHRSVRSNVLQNQPPVVDNGQRYDPFEPHSAMVPRKPIVNGNSPDISPLA